MDYIDTIRDKDGKLVKRYWADAESKQHWLKHGGKRNIIKIKE